MYRFFTLILACTPVFLATSCQTPTAQLPAAPPPVPVTVATASTEPAPLQIRVVGAVEPFAKVEIKAQIAGQLMSAHFTEGQDVSQGQLLLKIDPQPYREAARQAEAALERDRALLNQAESAVQRDIVQAKSAELEAARNDELLKNRLISSQQNLQYRTTADAAKETVSVDQAAVQSARASLKMDEAARDRANLDLSYTDIHAPMSGRAGNLLVQPGNLVKSNDVPLVVINRITPVFVSFNVPEQFLPAIRKHSAGGRRPGVRVTSRDDPGMVADGYLTLIDNTVDTQTGTVHLKAQFENVNRLLWPGQFVNVVLTLDSTQQATVVPAEAVQAGQQGPFVYIVKSDQKVEMRIVSAGRTLGKNVIIESGLKPGETVVTDGQMMLFPGAQITIAPAPGQPAGVP